MLEIFDPLKSVVVSNYKKLLESQNLEEPKATPCLDLYPTFYALVKCLNLDYDDTEILYMAKTIYRYRGNKKSVDELSRFLNINIELQGYPSPDLSTAVKIVVTADAYLDDTVLLVNLLKVQIPDLLWLSSASFEIELQVVRLTNVIDSFEITSTQIHSFNYVGGRDDISKNSVVFKYRIAG